MNFLIAMIVSVCCIGFLIWMYYDFQKVPWEKSKEYKEHMKEWDGIKKRFKE